MCNPRIEVNDHPQSRSSQQQQSTIQMTAKQQHQRGQWQVNYENVFLSRKSHSHQRAFITSNPKIINNAKVRDDNHAKPRTREREQKKTTLSTLAAHPPLLFNQIAANFLRRKLCSLNWSKAGGCRINKRDKCSHIRLAQMASMKTKERKKKLRRQRWKNECRIEGIPCARSGVRRTNRTYTIVYRIMSFSKLWLSIPAVYM